ncbi:MAG TPA: 30S ribosomal protein S16 [bacterium (Candidatus Stahlbacteria)]|nr:30S ribosomal protein S16 [Candidatus Stahlbacteria bacterium]
MAVRIRLLRIGRRKAPFYRIVVTDSRAPRDSKFIESIGYYNPLRKEELSLDVARMDEWLRKGAKPSNTVSRLMERMLKKVHAQKEVKNEGTH